MIDLLIGAAAAAHSPEVQQALTQCRPALARKAGGEINAIDADAARVTGDWVVIRGPMTVFIGEGPAAPGTATTHHLIRAQYDYACWVRDGRVRKTTLAQP